MKFTPGVQLTCWPYYKTETREGQSHDHLRFHTKKSPCDKSHIPPADSYDWDIASRSIPPPRSWDHDLVQHDNFMNFELLDKCHSAFRKTPSSLFSIYPAPETLPGRWRFMSALLQMILSPAPLRAWRLAAEVRRWRGRRRGFRSKNKLFHVTLWVPGQMKHQSTNFSVSSSHGYLNSNPIVKVNIPFNRNTIIDGICDWPTAKVIRRPQFHPAGSSLQILRLLDRT